MSFDQFHTYNREEWYAQEVVCDVCGIHECIENLQEIVEWATKHLTECDTARYYREFSTDGGETWLRHNEPMNAAEYREALRLDETFKHYKSLHKNRYVKEERS